MVQQLLYFASYFLFIFKYSSFIAYSSPFLNFCNSLISWCRFVPEIVKYILLLLYNLAHVAVYCLRSDFSMFKQDQGSNIFTVTHHEISLNSIQMAKLVNYF